MASLRCKVMLGRPGAQLLNSDLISKQRSLLIE